MNALANEMVTVIIPVYNVQAYLERCVDSVLAQTHENLQIIIINDGSTDGSSRLCDIYGAMHRRIEVIHQENRGLSEARNAGLDHARGQWVTFLDADDYFSRYFIEYNLAACLQYGTDLAVCRHIADFEGKLKENDFKNAPVTEIITGREAAIRHFGKDAIWLNPAWGKLSHISLWKNMRFPTGKINEDVFVSHQLLYNSNKVAVSDAYLYAYFQSPGSIMRKPFTLERLDVLDAWHEGMRFFERTGDRELYDIARRIYCNRLFDAFGICKKFLPNERETHKQIRCQAIALYKELILVRSYIDLSPKTAFAHRVKQFIGRYLPVLYTALFLRNRTYI